MRFSRHTALHLACLRVLIPGLLFIAVLYQVLLTVSFLGLYSARAGGPRAPFLIASGGGGLLISSPEKEALAAGLRDGETVLSIDGMPVRSPNQMRVALRNAHVADSLLTCTSRSNAAPRCIPVPLKPAQLSLPSIVPLLSLLFPYVCLGLGVWVLYRQSRSLPTWSFLALMMGFAIFPNSYFGQAAIPTWEQPWRTLTYVYRTLAENGWPIWMVVFGYSFPKRLRGRGARGIALLIAVISVPLCLFSALQIAVDVGGNSDKLSEPRLSALLSLMHPIVLFVSLVGFAAFFFLIQRKIQLAEHSDGRRRLRLVYAGTTLSMAPLCLFQIAIHLRGPSFAHRLDHLSIYCGLALFLFPLTLAYSLIVDNAMDLPVIVRQGLHYALGERAIRRAQTVTLLIAGSDATLLFMGWDSHRMAYLVTLIICLLSLAYLQHVRVPFRSWSDRLFFQNAHSSEQVLLDFCDYTLRDTGSSDSRALLTRMAEHLAQTFDASSAAAYAQTGGELSLLYSVGDPALHGLNSSGVFGADLVWSNHMSSLATEPRRLRNHDWLSMDEPIPAFTSRKRVVIPLRHGLELLGLISLGTRGATRPYTNVDLTLLRQVAERTSLRLSNMLLAGRLAQELAGREIKNAQQKAAEQASNAKSQFMARMSHELRNPLNAIIGYSELLTDSEDLDREQVICDLARITSSGKHLLALINDILDISRIEAGHLELFPELIDIYTLTTEAIALSRPLLQQKNNTFDSRVYPDSGVMIIDVLKARQILTNLLSNAGKFTESGTIWLTANAFFEGTEEFVSFSVEDTGVGLTDEQMGRLFQPYVQADSSTVAKYGGSGLGLAICRSYCDAMRGDISVSSSFGEGSTFIVRLPRYAKGYSNPASSLPIRAP